MASRKQVLLISLHNLPWFDEMYDALLAAVRSKADLERAEDATSALRLLTQQPPPSAVIVTDEALTFAKNTRIWDATIEYVRQGGTAVVMGLFPSFVQPDKINPFFSRAGLDWEVASYRRTTTVLNRAAVDTALAAKLPPSYSQKAVSVRNFAPTEAWYQPSEDSCVTGESAVVLARLGSGKLGYVGDVNAEKGSDAAILAMCGLG
ncbi:triacylglycerol lipase [Hirsutella rhossiliensis]|uniref:Triacylglycerol lipase n=1 Tax=Hirsutella rhossiliensis TaxID=111463 RepID=A0A9P8N628_9HYPO|nr:triacylglycerol lipase [Hirsutella rhossiliensis]KAH0967637.1 triacylglycerol lipase [Hirsutella rhossiliensis]